MEIFYPDFRSQNAIPVKSFAFMGNLCIYQLIFLKRYNELHRKTRRFRSKKKRRCAINKKREGRSTASWVRIRSIGSIESKSDSRESPTTTVTTTTKSDEEVVANVASPTVRMLCVRVAVGTGLHDASDDLRLRDLQLEPQATQGTVLNVLRSLVRGGLLTSYNSSSSR